MSVDEKFGESVRALRETAKLSQTELATRMKGRGHAFHQQTIQRIESGDRPVRLTEAIDLAELLESGVFEMAQGVALAATRRSYDFLVRSHDALVSVINEYEAQRRDLAIQLDLAAESGADSGLSADQTVVVDVSAVTVAARVLETRSADADASEADFKHSALAEMGVQQIGLPEGRYAAGYEASVREAVRIVRLIRGHDGAF